MKDLWPAFYFYRKFFLIVYIFGLTVLYFVVSCLENREFRNLSAFYYLQALMVVMSFVQNCYKKFSLDLEKTPL